MAVATDCKFVTLFKMIPKEGKPFTVELYSLTAEEAYVKERTIDKLVETQSNIERAELIGTFRKVALKIVGEEI